MPVILLIDDDNEVRKAISLALKHRNFGVFVANNGKTGLELFREVRFDAALVDIFMPELDGIGTIREMKAINATIPIVAISGHPLTASANGGPDFLGMAVKLGATSALQKPFSGAELVETINRCISPATLAETVVPADVLQTLDAAGGLH